jgi:tetratricopeptide (TPR) repeat protein
MSKQPASGYGFWAALLLASLGASASAQPAPAEATDSAPPRSAVATPKEAPPQLGEQLRALSQARLLSLESASADQLRALVAAAEQHVLDGRSDEAAVLLLEALESPRFADFHDFPEYAAAEHMAGQALYKVGALASARRYLERAVARGPENPYYGPALRRLVDVALALLDLQAAVDWLARHEAGMTEDARSELAYLRARIDYDRGEYARAAQALARIGKRSRFHGNAQYLLGAIAARAKRWKSAEQRFCAVAGTGVDDRYSFYVDERFFEVQDLARLALGRTAHEQKRGDDAFYYYFQVPRDSQRLPEALFEAAYASYESDDHDTAVDLLEQLEAHYPRSAFTDEARILRGYVSLARCDFSYADREFTRFIDRFSPLVAHIDRLLENRARRDVLYETLLSRERGARDPLVDLLQLDPEFYRLHEQVRALDAEAARAGGAADALDALRARFEGGDRPRAVDSEDAAQGAFEALQRDLGLAGQVLRSLGDQLDALRAARTPGKQLAAHERELGKIAERLHELERRALTVRARAASPGGGAARSGKAVAVLLAADVDSTRELPARVAAVREKLVAAASARAEKALRGLRARLNGLVRRARIGRIDAVMGSKRRIELQIESLAAGRFPAELRDPLRVQGLLADDEEYWPFEGEDWPDEYEERYGPGQDAGGRAGGAPR